MKNNKKYLLSTRPLDDFLVSRAAEQEIIIHSMPFIQTEPIINEHLKQQVNDTSGQLINVVFTSMNAAEAVAGYLTGKAPGWRIFCLGTATKKVVELHFSSSTIVGTASNASLLAEEIIKNDIKRVVFFCGDQRRDELPEKLASQNIQVEEIVVYNTTPIPRRIERNYDGILFFSPSAVESFFSANSIPGDTILFAIGGTTADCIRQFSKNAVVESDLPGKENLVEKAISYLDKSNQTNERIKK